MLITARTVLNDVAAPLTSVPNVLVRLVDVSYKMHFIAFDPAVSYVLLLTDPWSISCTATISDFGVPAFTLLLGSQSVPQHFPSSPELS